MADHTPGPWTVEDPMGPECLSIVQAGLKTYQWEFIALVVQSDKSSDFYQGQRFITAPEQEANARLIAAAPTMLAALQAIERHNDDPARYSSYINRIAMEAIAVATRPAAISSTGGHDNG